VPAGYFKTPEVRTFDSYPHLVHRALKERFPFAVLNVIVTAIGGEDSHRGAARFTHDVLPLRPDVVALDYALNDRKIGLTMAEIAWREMIGDALRAGAKALLLTPSGDLEADFSNADDLVNAHARQIRSLAEHFGIGLVDSTARFQAYCKNGGQLEELMSDTRHPNRNGHELIAATILEHFVIGKSGNTASE
jgi:hypothetical protein